MKIQILVPRRRLLGPHHALQASNTLDNDFFVDPIVQSHLADRLVGSLATYFTCSLREFTLPLHARLIIIIFSHILRWSTIKKGGGRQSGTYASRFCISLLAFASLVRETASEPTSFLACRLVGHVLKQDVHIVNAHAYVPQC